VSGGRLLRQREEKALIVVASVRVAYGTIDILALPGIEKLASAKTIAKRTCEMSYLVVSL
jgi:hypothetical protein